MVGPIEEAQEAYKQLATRLQQIEEVQKRFEKLESAFEALDKLREVDASIRRNTEIGYSDAQTEALHRALQSIPEGIQIRDVYFGTGSSNFSRDYLRYILEVLEGHKLDWAWEDFSHVVSLGQSYIWKLLRSQLKLFCQVVLYSLCATPGLGIALSVRVQQICATHPSTAPPRSA